MAALDGEKWGIADVARICLVENMSHAKTIGALDSLDVARATKVTYTLDGYQPEPVLAALRRNLERTDADLVEITVMRLGVRFKDVNSFQRIIDLAMATNEELVATASLKAIGAIGKRYVELKAEAEVALRTAARVLRSPSLRTEAAREYLDLIGELSFRQYVSRDEATILHRYHEIVAKRHGE